MNTSVESKGQISAAPSAPSSIGRSQDQRPVDLVF
jgi:hypothetical protein